MLAQVSAMLQQHERVESSSAWIRLAKLGESTLELEMQAYVLTHDYDDFTAVREDLLLRVMDLVKSCGTSLALPSHTVYFAEETKPAENKPAELRATAKG